MFHSTKFPPRNSSTYHFLITTKHSAEIQGKFQRKTVKPIIERLFFLLEFLFIFYDNLLILVMKRVHCACEHRVVGVRKCQGSQKTVRSSSCTFFEQILALNFMNFSNEL